MPQSSVVPASNRFPKRLFLNKDGHIIVNLSHNIGLFMNKRRLNSKGQASVELVIGLIAMIPVVLFFIDGVLLVLATTTNDSLCREAARAAASVQPSQSRARAQQVIDIANQSTGTVSQFTMVGGNLDTHGAADVVSTEGGIVQGNVTLSTQAKVRPLTILTVVNKGVPFTFTATQTFPYTFVAPQTSKPL